VTARKRWLARVGAIVVVAVALSIALLPNPPAQHDSVASKSPRASVSTLVRERFRLENGDGVIFRPNARNYASRTSATAPLLLFLPATRERPANYTAFLTAARARGFHVLALDYWNDGRSVQQTCGMSAQCYTDLQRTRLDGSNPTEFSAVDPANSIQNRFTMAIHHLARSDPSGGWSRFVTSHGINWRDIVLAGHSQGGGESAYIAHIHRVRGVLMFSSPVESDDGVYASWMSTAGQTPASRLYGFDDTGDVFASRIRASWDAIGMGAFGAPALVDVGVTTTSHELISDRPLGTPIESHSRDITDETPRSADGSSVFLPVWKWMLDRVWSPKA
jgi:hypothetical protein